MNLPLQKKDEELCWQVDREPNEAPSPTIHTFIFSYIVKS